MDNKFSLSIILNEYNFIFKLKSRSFKNLNCGQTCTKSQKGVEDWTYTISFTWNCKNVNFLLVSNIRKWINMDLFSKWRALHFICNFKLGKIQPQFKRNFGHTFCTWVIFSFILDKTRSPCHNGICCYTNGDQPYVEVVLKSWKSRQKVIRKRRITQWKGRNTCLHILDFLFLVYIDFFISQYNYNYHIEQYYWGL